MPRFRDIWSLDVQLICEIEGCISVKNTHSIDDIISASSWKNPKLGINNL